MGLLSTLFQNDKVKDAAFGMLKKTMIDNGVKFFVMEMGDDGNLCEPRMYNTDQSPVIYGREQIAAIEEIVNNQATKIEVQQEVIFKQSDIIHGLEREMDDLRERNNTLQNLVDQAGPSLDSFPPGTPQGLVGQAAFEYDNLLNPTDGNNNNNSTDAPGTTGEAV